MWGDKIHLERSDAKLEASSDPSKRANKPGKPPEVFTKIVRPTSSPFDDLLSLPDESPQVTQPEIKDDDFPESRAEAAQSTYTSAKIKREQFNAKMVEAQYRKLIAELVEVAQVERAVADTLGPVTRGLSSLGARIASRIAAVYNGEARLCQTLIDAEVEVIKDEIAEAMRALPDKLKGDATF